MDFKNGIDVIYPFTNTYIAGLLVHIRNIVFMFGPTNLDEVSVQATYIEVGKKGVSRESYSRKEDKRKWNGKNSNAVNRK
jgi:hypothetical protein